MPNPIELEPVDPENIMRSKISPEQLQSFISLIANTDPSLLILPSGKTFTDVKRFNVRALPNGSGIVNVVFV